MTFSSPGSGQDGGSRLLWWLLGIVMAAALVVLLFYVLTPVVLVLIWSSRGDEVEQAEAQWQRQSATKALDRLHSAAADGQLTDLEIAEAAGHPTDPEIAEAVGRLWSVDRTATQVRVPTSYPVRASGGCYLLVIALPLGPNSKSSLEVAASCPRWSPVAPTTAPRATS